MFTKTVLKPLFEAIEKFGDRNAFCIDDKFYTYLDFSRNISKIRKAIRIANPSSKNIGLLANDDIETYASIFAIWLEGMAYVPLHPNQPIDRSLEIISQADIELVIQSGNQFEFNGIESLNSKALAPSELNLIPLSASENDLAYILFTSGSTGNPKGVQIMRKNVGAFMHSFWKTRIQVSETDRCLQCFDLTFDVSVQAFLTPLTKGACTYTIPHNQIKYSYVYGLLEDHKLTFCVMAPSMLRYLRPYYNELNIPTIRYCILTAEASPLDLIQEWASCIPNAEIYDFYGPTEATIYCTYYKFNRTEGNKQLNGMLTIGKAMPGLSAIVIDENKNILGKNSKGELCICGNQLTPGYWKNEDKNKESFFEIEWQGIATRFYKTGDSCYIDDDGDIMLAGRIDYQVKIQGYRIELGEIEHHARDFFKGRNAVAVTFENKTGNTEIALFIESEMADTKELIDYLNSKMPYYMVPTKILEQLKLPLNVNGKIDRNALKKLIPN